MGFLTFLKKSKPASSSSPNDAELSIPPPPPFPQTAESQRDIPPPSFNEEDTLLQTPEDPPKSLSSELPDFKPFGQDMDSPPLGLPEVEEAKQNEDMPPQPDDQFFSPPRRSSPLMPPPPIEDDEPNLQEDNFSQPPSMISELPPLKSAPESKLDTPPPPKQDVEEIIRHPNGVVFMQAQRIAEIGDDLMAASLGLKKMGVRVQQIEEQERAMEEWKSQLEVLYRKLAATEKSIFAGD